MSDKPRSQSSRNIIRVLEPRMLFDGAAAATADATVAAESTLQGADSTAALDSQTQAVLDALTSTTEDSNINNSQILDFSAVPETSAINLQDASQQTQQLIIEFLHNTSSQQLFDLFSGGQSQPSQEWLNNYQTLLDNINNGQLSVSVQQLSSQELQGAYAAFTAQGLDGQSAIYLNADWIAAGAAQDQLSRVLTEEFGHFIDHKLNPTTDTVGEEGEAFAAKVFNIGLTETDLTRIAQEDDSRIIVVDGQQVNVELASASFTVTSTQPMFSGEQKYATFFITDPLEGSYDLSVVQDVGAGYADLGIAPTILFYNNVTQNWESYTAGSPVTVPSSGKLLVRVDVSKEWSTTSSDIDGKETFKLRATDSVTNISVDSIATIQDDWDGDGIADLFDLDSDNDGILNSMECPNPAPRTDGPQYWQVTPGTNSYYDDKGTADTLDDEIIVTENQNSQKGSIWAVDQLDLAKSFRLTASLFMGADDNGADGIAFVLQNSGPTAIGAMGGGVGYSGITPSLAIEFDTYPNGTGSGDLSNNNDHVSIQSNDVSTVVGAAYDLGNIEDGVYHAVEIVWNAKALQLQVKWDGNVVQTLNKDIVASYFSGDSTVYFGFTGSTGGAKNLQSISDLRIDAGDGVCPDTDNDGIPDDLDLDSDNDGYADALEASAYNANTAQYYDPLTGQFSGPVGSNGLLDGFEATPDNGQLNYTPTYDQVALSGQVSGYPPIVSNVEVNEASPYAIFTIETAIGQQLTINNVNQAAQDGLDYQGASSTPLEYWDGTQWVPFNSTDTITVPGEQITQLVQKTNLLVRVAILQDINAEGNESFQLQVTNIDGQSGTGTATIKDDGTGDLYGELNTTGVPDALNDPTNPNPVDPSLPTVMDDDRVLTVTGTAVNETSDYVFWSVTGEPGQPLTLVLQSGTAILGKDAGPNLEYYDPSNPNAVNGWVAYSADTMIDVPQTGVLQVRTAVMTDKVKEQSETLSLLASNASGTPFIGESSISDVGGAIAVADELPPTVSAPVVNEASPYMVFTISSLPGQQMTLDLTNGTAESADYGVLEYYDPSNPNAVNGWVVYDPANPVTVPSDGNLLVRAAINSDNVYEGAETVLLTATNLGGISGTGVGTIVDDGTGDLYGANNITGLPDALNDPADPSLPTLLDDDRANQPPVVSSFTVNEASPYAVFTINGVAGAGLTLGLSSGSATSSGADADYVNTIEVYNPVTASWVAYNPATTQIPDSGQLLARVAINQDTVYEVAETFSLNANYNSNGLVNPSNTSIATGTATIADNGTGLIFIASNTDPGVNDLGEPEIDIFTPKDNDRIPISIADIEVNEASPYAVFKVVVTEGQPVVLQLTNAAAQQGLDTSIELEYFDGSKWQPYTQGDTLIVPTGDPNVANQLLVRVAITNDINQEGAESLMLNVNYVGDSVIAGGTVTINDDGIGDLYGANNITGTPDALNDPANPNPADPSLPTALDDDRALTVTGTQVNEASDYVFWSVAGEPGQPLTLVLQGDTAQLGLDAGTNLEYYDPTNPNAVNGWVVYSAGTVLAMPQSGVLEVRTGVMSDNEVELSETLSLVASNAAGTAFEGQSTIFDVGGAIAVGNDVPPIVSAPVVNEASPYMVFTVTGAPDQQMTLDLTNGTAESADYGSLEVFDGNAWVAYNPNTSVSIPSNGQLLVRAAINSDNDYEGAETVLLTATNLGGISGTGVGTIVDDGTGDLYGANNITGLPDTLNDPAVLNPADPSLPTLLDDDRANQPPVVSSFTVNEASPYAVFTINGVANAGVTLALTDGTAQGSDHGSVIEVYNPLTATWEAYDPDTTQIPESGQLLARVAINQDNQFEVAETFSLNAIYNQNGVSGLNTITGSSGTATITDNATGVIFISNNTDPGVNDLGQPEIDLFAAKDDDREPISIGNIEVNEASPYAMFKVQVSEGQPVILDLASGAAQVGLDSGQLIEYYDPAANGGHGAWLLYTPGQAILVPSDGDNAANDPVTMLVRVAIINDLNQEGPESLSLSAQYAIGDAEPSVGIATIKDDGTGDLYGANNITATPDVLNDPTDPNPADPSLPTALDDDRALTVTGTQVNEASDYVFWSVAGESGQLVTLMLESGTATIGRDAGPGLEFYDPNNPMAVNGWVAYTSDMVVEVPQTGVLQVRSVVISDTEAELSENLNLVVSNNSGTAFDGQSTILDVGGAIAVGDEVPPTVSAPVVNEASPYMVFTISSLPGQQMTLDLTNGTAESADYSVLEYYDPSNPNAVNGWVVYDPVSPVTVPSDGNLLVRAAINSDNDYEGAETVLLTATNLGGISGTGLGTIVDDGTGELFSVNNTSGLPDAPGSEADLPATSAALDDDRATQPPVVSSFTVNEASPYAMFTINGVAGAGVTLNLTDGSADGSDYGTIIEVYDPVNNHWLVYSPDTLIPASGQLLARVAINQDSKFEGPETFSLKASYNNNGIAGLNTLDDSVGTATIVDDGTGLIFLSQTDNPDTAIDETNLGVNNLGQLEIDRFTPKDDDRVLSVNSMTVNEGSPYVVFTLTAVEGQSLLLDLASGEAQIGDDTGTQLQYFDGQEWKDYTPGTPITVPGYAATMPNEAVALMVRVAIRQDPYYEGLERFTLNASYATNPTRTVESVCTINDWGSGAYWIGDSLTPATQQQLDAEGILLDNDLPLNGAQIVDFNGFALSPSNPVDVVWTISNVFLVSDNSGNAIRPEFFGWQYGLINWPGISLSGDRDHYQAPWGDMHSEVMAANLDLSMERGNGFTVPMEALMSLDTSGGLRYDAALSDGAALPAWLAFDPKTGRLSLKGQSPHGQESIKVKIEVTDNKGNQVAVTVILKNKANSHERSTQSDKRSNSALRKVDMSGKQAFSEQIKLSGSQHLKHTAANLVKAVAQTFGS